MGTNDLLFIYGRTPDLARYEAQSVYQSCIFQKVSEECDLVSGIDSTAGDVMKRLGGIVRIAKECAIIEEIEPHVVSEIIRADHKDQQQISFILSVLGNDTLASTLSKNVKRELHEQGIHARYILPSGHTIASSAQVFHRGVTEYLVVRVMEKYVMARTIAVQDVNSWTHRDMERPRVDAKRGMLPLKVARMVVNIAIGAKPEDKVCADPFCGMGTIPSEGWMLGSTWYASDVAPEAVEGASRNIQWLTHQYHKETPVPQVFVSDAVHLHEKITKESLDAIVTEPFLGNPALGEGKITEQSEISNILKGLEKLYIGCLKEWHTLLKVNGRVVMAIPVIVRGERKQTVKKVIDSCEILGYSIEAGPFQYSRPDAIVQRNFYIFKKNKTEK